MKECQYGCEIFIKDKLPRFTKKQRIPTDSAEFEMIKKKIDKVQSRRYIDGGTVLSLTALFYVPKGEDDIRLVYDLTALVLNDAFWVPTFWMPSVETFLDVATHFSWFGYIDAAEMFHKYKISEILQPSAGVEVSWSEKVNVLR